MSLQLYVISSIRTNNFTDNEIANKFDHLWRTTLQKTKPNVVLYAVYHDYESDFRGDYTCTTASEVDNDNPLIEINDQSYKVFHCQRETVVATWKNIWQQEENSELKRAYKADYEKYLPDGTVEIYIGVQP